jgi:glycosyltransferase involved in cell wall biosynthesis
MGDVLVIIPAFNEEETIVSTLRSLESFSSYDYLVVNDGSEDGTRAILEDNGYRHLDLPVNLGIGGAMHTGYVYASRRGYRYALQLDADGQHDPCDLEKLVEEIRRDEHDMVIGSRFVERTDYSGSWARRAGIFYFQHLIRVLTGLRVADPTSGYRVVNRRVIEEFVRDYPADYPEVEVLISLARKGYRVKEIPVEMRDRQGGASSITPLKSLYYMAKVTLFLVIRRFF